MGQRSLLSYSPGACCIAPSILAANFAALGDSVRAVEAAGAEVLHIDVMDGHFVPNLSLGPAVVEALRPHSGLVFDVHLMVTNPDPFVEPFVRAGADHVTLHVEAADDVGATLDHIHRLGCTAGLSLRPQTPAAALIPYLAQVEMVLVMSVEPGFGGQAFIGEVVPKIAELHALLQATGRPVHLEVDGGITAATAPRCCAAGANVLVAGSSVFRAREGIAAAIRALRAAWPTA